jgi:hypothetical protein
MHNKFKDIVGCITKVERSCIDRGKEEFILALLAQPALSVNEAVVSATRGKPSAV